LLLTLVYVRMAIGLVRRVKDHAVQHEQLAIILASFAVLLIALALQPTYKMLGFSLIMAILLTLPANASGKKLGKAC
jgi:hypothetical protein